MTVLLMSAKWIFLILSGRYVACSKIAPRCAPPDRITRKLSSVHSGAHKPRVSACRLFSDCSAPNTAAISGNKKNAITARFAACSQTLVHPLARIIAPLFNSPVDQADIGDREQPDDDRQDVGGGGAGADIERRREPLLIAVPGGHPGRVAWTSLRDRQHLIEDGERERGAQHENDDDDGP